MGTRKSRHNRGRKPAKHMGVTGVLCSACYCQFFVRETVSRRHGTSSFSGKVSLEG